MAVTDQSTRRTTRMSVAPLRIFFGTAPQPCPYLDGENEAKVVTELVGAGARALHDRLTQAGFRRSHDVAYKPACPGCAACVATRIPVQRMVMKRWMRRNLRGNGDIAVRDVPLVATVEQFDLFHRYQIARHGDGGMAQMDFADYRALVEQTPTKTLLTEFRDPAGRLQGAALSDVLIDGYSAVYSFFDPEDRRRGLGTFAILNLVERARAEALPHVYLGYWIAASPKMVYKTRFQPLEGLTPGGWQSMAIE